MSNPQPFPPIYGRERELKQLCSYLQRDSVWAVWIHGLGGIGKSALLGRFLADCREKGLRVAALDGDEVEPTAAGFLDAFGRALGETFDSIGSLQSALRDAPGPWVVGIDRYESLRLLDAWLRRTLLPATGQRLRFFVADRQPPVMQWSIDPVLGPHFQSLGLGEISRDAARELLRSFEIDPGAVDPILEFACGHPLALHLAGIARRERSDSDWGTFARDRVFAELTQFYLDGIDDPLLRRSVEAASVVRRIDAPMLGAMLDLDTPEALYDELAALHFVEVRPDGLALHDVVRASLGQALQARDPEAVLAFRRAAWRRLRSSIAGAPPSLLWRYTADLLFLIENPVVREAFFPSEERALAVEPARFADFASIRSIVARHDSRDTQRAIAHWWRYSPEAFSVVRSESDEVVGFYCVLDSGDLDDDAVAEDPLVLRWWTDLQATPDALPRALLLRRWLAAEEGESPCPVQAVCWIDLKRRYLELRPGLRRVYLAVEDPSPYAAVASQLGFTPLARSPQESGPVSVVLDFGPGSVDGWVAGLFSRELGGAAVGLLDRVRRQIIGPEGPVDLSPLEFGVLDALVAQPGIPVARAALLEEVWGIRHEGSSNVVDVVVRSLRRKLGPRSDWIQTVRGLGYCFSPPDGV